MIIPKLSHSPTLAVPGDALGAAVTLLGLQLTFTLLISLNVKGQEQPMEPAIE
jgi:hypothetical protein